MYMNLSIQGNKDKGKDKAIEVSSETNSEATVTVTPPRPKGVVIGSPKWRSSGKAKKSRKKCRCADLHRICHPGLLGKELGFGVETLCPC